MHELSIALSIVESATEKVQEHPGTRVTAIHLRLGPLSGVVKDALLFSYEIACLDTPLVGSRLLIEETPVVIFCDQCHTDRQLENFCHLACPVCGALSSTVRGGKELEFVAMEIEDKPPDAFDLALGSNQFEQLEEVAN